MHRTENLILENERQLSEKPLGIDILIIKKNVDIPIRKNIGRIFRRHNIVEYKSLRDYLGVNDFYKVYAYACLYTALTEREDEIRTKEMSITFISYRYPRKLERYLERNRRYRFEEREKGIYEI